MKILDDSGNWSMEAYCLGNDPELEEHKGCFTKVELNSDDIEIVDCETYNMFGRAFPAIELFMFTCPTCGKKTIISSKLIPEEIKENIRETKETTFIREFKRK